jgi:lipoprotein NlpI
MTRTHRILAPGLLACLAASVLHAEEQSVDELLVEARQAFERGDSKQAFALADRAVASDGKSGRAVYVRGLLHEAMRNHSQALADFNRVLQLKPEHADAYDHRGSEQFKLGRIAESIADFDKAIELDPARERGHWKRGISYYYAGRFDEGRKQFEQYQTFDDNDVENAVWRYLCMARSVGASEAQKDILKIKDDRRVPMMQVHALYAGRLKPEEVLAAARAGEPSPEELNARLFYAELYLGLYYEAAAQPDQAAEHLAAAVKHRIGHYMWDVARVHSERLKDR